MADRRNTEPGALGDETFGGLTHARAAREAHQRLFGKGAKVSGYEGKVFATPDERAWNQRPKSATYGRDIHLPRDRKKANATKGASLSKRSR